MLPQRAGAGAWRPGIQLAASPGAADGSRRAHGEKLGNRLYYRANQGNPTFSELQGLLAKTSGLAWVLKEALSALEPKISLAFIYGSIASGQETASSDVDLFVVGDAGLFELAPPLRELGLRLGREVNPTVYGAAEFASKMQAKSRFLLSIVDKPKLFIVGTEDDLRAALEGAASSPRTDESG